MLWSRYHLLQEQFLLGKLLNKNGVSNKDGDDDEDEDGDGEDEAPYMKNFMPNIIYMKGCLDMVHRYTLYPLQNMPIFPRQSLHSTTGTRSQRRHKTYCVSPIHWYALQRLTLF
jgi:hypothetical protein